MIEKRLRDKIEQLIARASGISDVPFGDRTEEWKANGEAWVTEAVNAVELAVPDYINAYRRRMVTASQFLIPLPERVPVIASLLRSLLGDIDAGLVGTFKTKVQAETFDNFLDHAVAHRHRGRKDQAAVIAGAVFEDTVRKIHADKIGGVTTGKRLDGLITDLTQKGVITQEQSRQARTAAFVRTKASHAEWTEFSLDGVTDTIKITKALLKTTLASYVDLIARPASSVDK